MRRVFVLLILIALICSTYATATPDAGKCQKPLITDQVKQDISSREEKINELISQYEAAASPFDDPFAMVFSPEEGERIFQTLSTRKQGEKVVFSPLGAVNQALSRVYLESKEIEFELIDWVIKDAEEMLQSKPELQDLQSNLLGLKYTREYLGRFREPEEAVDRDGEPEKKAEDKPEKKPKKKQEEQDSPPEYPDLPDAYKPHTKDTENQGEAGKQKQHRIAEVNFKTPFFGQRYFNQIVRNSESAFREIALPAFFDHPRSYAITERELIVRTFGKKVVPLFLPPGYRPLQPSDPRAKITREETGGYKLTLSAELADVKIPLVDDAGLTMLPHLRAVFERKVGFRDEEWPDQVRAAILNKFSKEYAAQNSLAVAQAISEHLAKDYLYSVGARGETDPIEALKAGAFQCDMASFAMVGLLRDVYGIPSRVVGGYRGKHFKNGGDGKSYLVSPGEAHAWIEVFHDGRWHAFDPTPVKKDRKKDEKGEGKDEYSDNELENAPKPDEQQDQEGEGEGKGEKVDQQAKLEKNSKDRLDKTVEKGEKAEKTDKAEKGEEQGLSLDDLAAQLELGSLELDPKMDRNALLERAARILLQISLEPNQSGLTIQNRLEAIRNLMKRFSSPQLKQLYKEAKIAHGSEHSELRQWIEQVGRLARERDIAKTFQEVYRIRAAVELYTKLLDRDGKIPVPLELLDTLNSLVREIGAFAHADSRDIGIVKAFTDTLPAVARQLLTQKYNFQEAGSNGPTKAIARDLKAGKLNDLRLLAILAPLSDFILNSTPRPEFIEIKTWLRNPTKTRGRDILPLQRFSDISRAILGQPGKSIEENLQAGSAYVLTTRKRALIPAGHGKEDAERITIVLYDTSGSMSGPPAKFQAGLISAFTARALSDISPSGKHRHRIVIVPFDDKVGEPVRVTNSREALDIIENYQSKLANSGGGTDIQKALLQAMALIADAEKRSGEPLAAANIILMTDGGSEIDSEALYRARQAIDRNTPLQTMFIAINQTNEDLIKFANDSQRMGMERGFYREFTQEHISELLALAEKLDLSAVREDEGFYTEKSASDLPQSVYDLFAKAARLGSEFSDSIYYGSRYRSAREHLEQFEKIRWQGTEHVDRPLEQWLVKLRNFTLNSVFSDRRILERVVDDLVENFERLTGIQKQQLSGPEQEHLRHLLRHAAGLE